MTIQGDNRGLANSQSGGPGRRALRTDGGTAILHLLIVALFMVIAATGLRIASDVPALRWLVRLDAILPVENLWYWHVIAGLCFSAVFFAYIAYMISARLGRRVRVDGNRLRSLLRPGPTRWSAIGVLVIWIGAVAFAVEIVTGMFLYGGQAGLALTIHRTAMWVCLALPVIHVWSHYRHGGARQLLRIFRPTRLVLPPPEPDILLLLEEHVRLVDDLRAGREPPSKPLENFAANVRNRRPYASAAITALAVVALGVAFELLSGDRLLIPALPGLIQENRPVIDGDISDPVWVSAPAVRIQTDQGINFDDAGQSEIEVRAVHDGEHIYFAFTWDDPTRSLKHFPLVKTDDGWRVAMTDPEPAKEAQYIEDKFSVLLSRPGFPLIGGAIHLSPRPVPSYPASASGRGLHYTQPGGLVDVWVWRASQGGLTGYLEDAEFTGPKKPTPGEISGAQPYRGGFGPDAGDNCYADNVQTFEDGTLAPRRVPRNPAMTEAELGDVHETADISDDTGSRWWISADESEPYTRQADRRLAVGAIIPGVILSCRPSGDRADVRGVAQWAAGRWTLETVRRLDTRSDHDIPIETGVQMWLAAFDHSATHHTRHLRPITLELL